MQRSYLAIAAVLVWLAGASQAPADPFSTDIFYTRFAGFERVKTVSFSYDGVTTVTLGTPTVIATIGDGLTGADGIAFDPNNGRILIGAQGPFVHSVSPVGAPGVLSASTSGPAAFHLAVNTGGSVVHATGIPGAVSNVPIGASFGTAGTVIPVVSAFGGDTTLTSLVFAPGSGWFYTRSGGGGFGSFGSATDPLIAPIVTTQLIGPAATGSVLPAAHGAAFDAFTGHIIVFGDDHITQIDPVTGLIVSDLDLAALGFGFLNLDQGGVDGTGHALVASNSGHLVFLDYSGTGLVGAGAGNFLDVRFLDSFLDDVAPLSGEGAPLTVIPEPTSLAIWGLVGLGGAAYGWRRKRRQGAANGEA